MSETVGELIERMGEREAYMYILARNIAIRAAAFAVYDAYYRSRGENTEGWQAVLALLAECNKRGE